MKEWCFLILFSFICKINQAQNLVPNGDFETYTSCPTGLGFIFISHYGFSGGKIQFNYMDLPKRFGQTLEKQEALKIVEELNLQVSKFV